MTRTVADRMAESAARGSVGRERELGALRAAVAAPEPPFLVAFVHGPAGIGKSHPVRRLLADLPAPVRGLSLDARDIEPTPRGLRRALGQTLGLPDEEPSVAELVRALAPRPAVLVIDTYEVLGLLDTAPMEVVVEGVENPAQASVLRALGVRLAQGYHLGRPVPSADLVLSGPGGPGGAARRTAG